MKKFVTRVQDLSRKATEIRQAIESVPPKIAEVRDAVTTATGQVQKLRADILSGVATLRSETDTQLVTALREIDAGADVLAEAGVRLAGVDMDLGPTRRLIVHLERVHDMDVAHLRALHAKTANRPTVHALLTAIVKADELADNVDLTYLGYTKLIVEVGLIPSVRIGWRTEELEKEAPPAPVAAPKPAAQPSLSTAPSLSGSFFERRTTVPAAAPETSTTAEHASSTRPVPAAAGPIEPKPAQPGGSKGMSSALERFKRMPDLTKRSG